MDAAASLTPSGLLGTVPVCPAPKGTRDMAETTKPDIPGMTFRVFATLFHGAEPVVEAGLDHHGMRDSCHGREVTRTREVVPGATAFFTVVDDGDVSAFRRSLRQALATPFSRRLAASASAALGLHVDADTPDAVVDRVVDRFLALRREPRPEAMADIAPRATARGMADLLACHRRAVDRALAEGRHLDPAVRQGRATGDEDAWVETVTAARASPSRGDVLPRERDDPEAGTGGLAM